jgi:hypothetical protein
LFLVDSCPAAAAVQPKVIKQGKASWPATADHQSGILLLCREGVRFTIVAFCTFQYNNNKAYFDVKKCTLIICTDNSENKVRKIRTNQSWKNLP